MKNGSARGLSITRRLALCCAGLCLAACSASQGEDARPWSAARVSHGLVYADETPAGQHLRFIATQQETSPCALFEGGAVPASLTYVSVSIEGRASGEYNVGGDRPSAEVTRVVTRGDAKLSRIEAVSGTVRVQFTGDETGDAELDVRVVIPKQSATQLECQVIAQASGTISSSCECERPDGSLFSCERRGNTHNCCLDEVGETEVLEMSVRSEFCAGMCSELAGLGLCL